MEAYFEPVAHDDACDYCTGRRPIVPLPVPLDAVYCISLQEQPQRTRRAAEHFHQIGLCRHVTFYRPLRGAETGRAIWESHRAVARDALAKGCRGALVLEDDALFRRNWATLAPEIARAFAVLPQTWWGLFLGHLPWQAYFVRRNVLRVRSTCMHAYIANGPLLDWIATTEPGDAALAMWRPAYGSIDSATMNLPEMYALFPMAALQRYLGDYSVDPRVDRHGRRRRWNDTERWRNYTIFHGALVLQALGVVLSPFHRLTLERFRERNADRITRDAQLIRAAGFRDDGYYRSLRPDVAMRGLDPLGHYLHHGAAEGCRPYLLFDPAYYAAQSPDIGNDNALAHFVRVGAALNRNPHLLFDTGFYRARYGAQIPPSMNPLAHFLATGGIAGNDPHPLFDSTWYLSQHPALKERGQNPLVHYLTEGWRHGASPHLQFDGDLYLQRNPDVKAAGVNPLEHFVQCGQAEGRAQPIPAATRQPITV
jgi:GR25 family glycosyltransferase involved in LPS biosynthesis